MFQHTFIEVLAANDVTASLLSDNDLMANADIPVRFHHWYAHQVAPYQVMLATDNLMGFSAINKIADLGFTIKVTSTTIEFDHPYQPDEQLEGH